MTQKTRSYILFPLFTTVCALLIYGCTPAHRWKPLLLLPDAAACFSLGWGAAKVSQTLSFARGGATVLSILQIGLRSLYPVLLFTAQNPLLCILWNGMLLMLLPVLLQEFRACDPNSAKFVRLYCLWHIMLLLICTGLWVYTVFFTA